MKWRAFWSSFHTARDLAIVGLMLMHGLRSAEVLALNPEHVLLSEAQLRVHGKGNKLRFLPLARTTACPRDGGFLCGSHAKAATRAP
jgi:site-specific recombinase XerC